jgi:hypothetical protein
MRFPRVRFTMRRMMVIIATAAIILAVTHQVLEGRRQRALVARLHQEIELNNLAQAELMVISEGARRQHARPEAIEDYQRSLGELRQEEQALRQRLSRLRP